MSHTLRAPPPGRSARGGVSLTLLQRGDSAELTHPWDCSTNVVPLPAIAVELPVAELYDGIDRLPR